MPLRKLFLGIRAAWKNLPNRFACSDFGTPIPESSPKFNRFSAFQEKLLPFIKNSKYAVCLSITLTNLLPESAVITGTFFTILVHFTDPWSATTLSKATHLKNEQYLSSLLIDIKFTSLKPRNIKKMKRSTSPCSLKKNASLF